MKAKFFALALIVFSASALGDQQQQQPACSEAEWKETANWQLYFRFDSREADGRVWKVNYDEIRGASEKLTPEFIDRLRTQPSAQKALGRLVDRLEIGYNAKCRAAHVNFNEYQPAPAVDANALAQQVVTPAVVDAVKQAVAVQPAPAPQVTNIIVPEESRMKRLGAAIFGAGGGMLGLINPYASFASAPMALIGGTIFDRAGGEGKSNYTRRGSKTFHLGKGWEKDF